MDPAFLVWIPPIDEVQMDEDVEDSTEPHYDEILPRHEVDPGSNKETPEEELPCLPRKPPRKSLTNSDQQNEEIKSLLSKSPKAAATTAKMVPRKASMESIQLVEIRRGPYGGATVADVDSKDKETPIVITDNRIADYYGLSDIQFADEDLDEEVRYIDEHKVVHTTSFSSSSRVSRVSDENRYKV